MESDDNFETSLSNFSDIYQISFLPSLILDMETIAQSMTHASTEQENVICFPSCNKKSNCSINLVYLS
jgi:hypothetical protein